MDKKQTVFKAALGLSALSVISKLLGFAREQAIAWRFGASAEVDAFVAAQAIPLLLAGILGGVIATAFLPVFSSEREAGRGHRLAGTTFYATVGLSVLGTLLAFIFAPLIVRGLVSSFSVEQQALTVTLLRIMSAGTLLMGLACLLTMLFNGHQQFIVPALHPLVQNSIVLAGLMAIGAASIRGLAWYTLLGMAVPVALLIVVAIAKGLPLLDRPRFNDPAFVQVLRLSAPIFFGSLFGQLYIIVDRNLASGLDAGSMASLNFANKLVQLPVGIFVVALATAVYPTLTEHAARGDKKSFAEAVSSSVRGLALLIIPAAVGIFVLRYPVVRLAFERGSFDTAATTKTAIALGYYALGLVGLAVAQVLVRAFYALQDTATPVKMGIATAFVNIVLAVLLVGPLRHGGLALANSIGFLFNAGVLLYILSTKVEKGTLRITPVLVKGTVAAVVMGLASSAIYRLSAGFGQIVSLGAAAGIGIIVYVIMLFVLRVDEVWVAVNMARQKMGM